MQCLNATSAKDLESEIDGLDEDYDSLQAQPRRLEAATRDRRAAFEAATHGHHLQDELLGKIGAGSASGTLGVARAILADLRSRLAAGESPTTTTTSSVGAAASK